MSSSFLYGTVINTSTGAENSFSYINLFARLRCRIGDRKIIHNAGRFFFTYYTESYEKVVPGSYTEVA